MEEKDSDISNPQLDDKTSPLSKSSSFLKNESFKPVNFPPSESFSSRPLVQKTLPGVLPARETPFESNTDSQGEQQSEEVGDYEDDPDYCNTFFHCILAVIVLLGAILLALVVSQKNENTTSPLYMHDFDIMQDINQYIVGQSQAVYAVLNALQNMTHHPEEISWCKVLLLTGGPGVGKDYMAQIIKDKFYSIGGEECKEQSYHTLFPAVIREIQFCWRPDFNIYSFDTIYTQDESQVIQAVKTLKFITRICKDFNRKLTLLVPVLPVKAHSVQETGQKGVDALSSSTEYLELIRSEGSRIQKILKDAEVSSEVIIFRPIGWKDLRKCISHSAQQQGRATLSPQAIDEIVRMLRPLDSQDADFVPVGCKDVDALVALLPPKASEETEIPGI
jgi:hypothetical protein